MSNGCHNCGKVYNQYIGDRFWSGEYDVLGEIMTWLCDGCHRKHVRGEN